MNLRGTIFINDTLYLPFLVSPARTSITISFSHTLKLLVFIGAITFIVSSSFCFFSVGIFFCRLLFIGIFAQFDLILYGAVTAVQ